ncbi:M42 family metallopeptidase [Novibacillus thermophilus]|uniref:Peptidase M28 n=1 Tax=Novibacillus thermophilus TaxID=1471761 RepID=A0A1U9K4T7_9BACL|nr:M42 family metallopeptidase [Novibacillus thermophilus]AQS55042.1 peptidase M28 [Novibacillus thermophilus]
MDQELTILKELTEADGAPGFEGEVRDVMKRHIESVTTEIYTDHLGGIVGKLGESGPKVLLAGHLDEVAFMVSKMMDNGFLRLQPLGGWWGHVMLSQRVKIKGRDRDVIGVIGSKPPHVLPPDARSQVVKTEHMFIDIGVGSREEAENAGVQVGDPVIPICPFEEMANPKYLLGKAMDNRTGCYMALQLLKQLKDQPTPNQIYAGATVQEEVGLRGATTLVRTVQPDIAIALDVGIAEDTPGMESESKIALGKGPLITFYDATIIPHRTLRDRIVQIAREQHIPYQVELMGGGGTDAGKFHLYGEGVPSIVIGVPSRYIHSHVSVVHRDDLENGIKLVKAFLQQLDEEMLKEIVHGISSE